MPNAWTGIMMWYMNLWARDYLLRAQALVLCAMRNNLDSKYDAEWYLSVLQQNVLDIVGGYLAFSIFNPVGTITLAIVTLSAWFWVIVILAVFLDLLGGYGAMLSGYCGDVGASLAALAKEGSD